MSNTTVIYPMVAALAKAEEILGPQPNWQAVNETQEHFLKEFFAPCYAESSSIAEIESIIAWDTNTINRFLQEHGFTLQLRSFAPNEFGVASVLDSWSSGSGQAAKPRSWDRRSRSIRPFTRELE